MILTSFVIAATIVFAWLFMIWKSTDYLNLSLRLTFLIMLVWGIINIVKAFTQ